MDNAEKFIKGLKPQLNILDVSGSSSRHPKCRGYRTQDIGWDSEENWVKCLSYSMEKQGLYVRLA